MKLCYLFISIFCVRIFGLVNYLGMIFCTLFFKHIENRLPQLLNEYKSNYFLYYLNQCFKIKNYITNNNMNNTIYYSIISSNIIIPVINLYCSIEYYYLILLNEIMIMFSSMIMNSVTLLLSTSITNTNLSKVTNRSYKQEPLCNKDIKKIMSQTVDSDDDLFLKNESNSDFNSDSDSDILSRIKKKNNIKNLNNKKFDPSLLLNNLLNDSTNMSQPLENINSIDLNDLNNMNLKLMSLTNMLHGVVSGIKKDKTT